MKFDDRFKEELKSRTDILRLAEEYGVVARQAAGRYKALCPFHTDSQPSFYIDPQKGYFKCFGCGAGGDVFSFVMLADKLDFPAAVERLAERAGLPLPEMDDEEFRRRRGQRATTLELNKLAARWFYQQLYTPAGASGLEYFRKRGINDSIVRRFGLGYAPDSYEGLLKHAAEKSFSPEALKTAGLALATKGSRNMDMFRGRVMFPIIDEKKEIVGFGGRVLGGGEPKYLNSPQTILFDKHRKLFGMNLVGARLRPDRALILVEGYMDVLALHRHGFCNAVAALGTAFGPEHAKLIKRFAPEVIVCFDGDTAGVKAAMRSFESLEKADLQVRVLRLPQGRDPDDALRDEGAENFAQRLQNALTVPDFRMTVAREGKNMAQDGARAAFARECAVILAGIQSPVEREAHMKRWVEKLAVDTGISADSFHAEVARELEKQNIAPPKRRRAALPEAVDQEATPAEKQAVALLYNGSSAWLSHLEDDDFAHPLACELIKILQEHNGDATAATRALPPDDLEAALALTMAEVPGQPDKLLPELIARLKADKKERRLTELQAMLESGTGDTKAILQEIKNATTPPPRGTSPPEGN
ncbi:MAG: DNA primase [Clostridia bacterium]|nr:DNA primase [Clostridia bacterium]